MRIQSTVFRPLRLAAILAAAFASVHAGAQVDMTSSITTAAAPKNRPVKNVTGFTQALRCMDELFLAFDKKGIVVTSTGVPDETGKVKTGTKDMVVSAVNRMSLRSKAFEFIDFHSAGGGVDDLRLLFEAKGAQQIKMPDFYIRGSVTQMDDNVVRNNKGFGIAFPFLDFSISKDDSYDLLTIDMSIGDAATRQIVPETSVSNTIVVVKSGRSAEGGGKIEKAGISFNLDLSRSEGTGAAMRSIVELSLIESLGKFTRVPYWKCLGIESSNPRMQETALDWYESATDKDKVLFVQRKLTAIGRYRGPVNGVLTQQLGAAIAEYQSAAQLTANGQLNFETYFSLLDDTQNQLVALPNAGPRPAPPSVASAVNTAPAGNTQGGGGGTAPAALKVNLTSDRGSNASYKVGELFNVSLSLAGRGQAYCYYEDASGNTARIFPNRFRANSELKAGEAVKLSGGGFKIKFDRPGKERIACMASSQEVIPPSALTGFADLQPLPGTSLDTVVAQYKQANPAVNISVVEANVQ